MHSLKAALGRYRGFQEGGECVVCLNTLTLGDSAQLPCGHRLHTECAAKAMEAMQRAGGLRKCPMCAQPNILGWDKRSVHQRLQGLRSIIDWYLESADRREAARRAVLLRAFRGAPLRLQAAAEPGGRLDAHLQRLSGLLRSVEATAADVPPELLASFRASWSALLAACRDSVGLDALVELEERMARLPHLEAIRRYNDGGEFEFDDPAYQLRSAAEQALDQLDWCITLLEPGGGRPTAPRNAPTGTAAVAARRQSLRGGRAKHFLDGLHPDGYRKLTDARTELERLLVIRGVDLRGRSCSLSLASALDVVDIASGAARARARDEAAAVLSTFAMDLVPRAAPPRLNSVGSLAYPTKPPPHHGALSLCFEVALQRRLGLHLSPMPSPLCAHFVPRIA
jgi:hypothetical protein